MSTRNGISHIEGPLAVSLSFEKRPPSLGMLFTKVERPAQMANFLATESWQTA